MRFEAPDLHQYVTSETLQELGLGEYTKVDTFPSDYDDYDDEFGFELNAHVTALPRARH